MEKKRLILLASPTLRRGPLSALQRFVRDYERFLDKYEIVTTEGCHRAILRSGVLQNHDDFAVHSGYHGGVVRLSSIVVDERERQTIEAVIYFIDPRDPSSIFPETNAIKRECVVHGVTFLSTSRAAREWAAMKWAEETPHFISSAEIGGLHLLRPLSKETIALIAHDGKKKELLMFARDHFDFLLNFRERVATGTTGTLLNGERPDSDRMTQEEWDKEEFAPICAELRQKIETAKLKQFVNPMKSGPKGGDVMIAMKVLERDCQRIVFFENPLKPHEHTEDIQLLERTGRLRGKYTICVHDQNAAESFMKHWEATPNPSRFLISSALERLFGVKCVVIESSGNRTWEKLKKAAGSFLLAHIVTLANDRKKLGQDLRVSVSWGIGSSGVVTEMKNALNRLSDIDQKQENLESSRHEVEDGLAYSTIDDYPFRTYSLADDRYFRPGNVIVAPIQGLVGSVDETVEANEIAHRMKELFNGHYVPLAANALVQKSGDEEQRRLDRERRRLRFEKVDAHWENTDVVLATAGPAGEKPFEERPNTPRFRDFIEEVMERKVCGDLGGLLLDRSGKPVELERFDTFGMSADQLKKVRMRRGVVIVSGAQEERTDITLAALLGGWISVLITDTDFARNLLKELASRVDSKQVTLMPPETDGPLVSCVRRAIGMER